MKKSLRTNTIIFLVFFSLSGSVDSEPPFIEDQSPIYEMRAEREEEVFLVTQSLFSAEEEQELLQEEGLSLDLALDLQNQVLERQIQQADDMGNELDKIIQMLEE